MTALTQVVKTKISLPRRRSHLLTRTRLLTVLEKIHDYRIVIVVAPAGYGKSSLLIDFAHSHPMKTCWYAIDALDNNPLRFLNHFVASIKHQFPHFGSQTQSILNEQINVDQDYVDRLLVSLVNDIYEQIEEPMTIMVDDYHLVGNNQLINYFVGTLAQLIDEDCHLVITSRATVDLPELALMIGRTQITGLGMSELAFKPDEIQSLFQTHLGLDLASAEAETLAEDTEGWITGVLLSAQTKAGNVTNNLYQARLSGINVHDYLAQQIFDQQTPTMQRFLLLTALLQEFNAVRCQEVLSDFRDDAMPDWETLIRQLAKNNLFVTWVDADGSWLRYHHLFQAFLEQMAITQIPQEREHILRTLGDINVEAENWEEAYSYYTQIGRVQDLVNLIKIAGLPLVRQGQFSLLKTWLGSIPEASLQQEPILISLRGTIEINLGQFQVGLQLQDLAITLARNESAPSQLIQILLDRAITHRYAADYEASLQDASEALDLSEQSGELVSQADSLRIKGSVHYHLGQFDQSVDALEKALSICQILNQGQNIAAVRLELGLVYTNLGFFERAQNYNAKAFAYWQETNNLAWQANICINQGLTYFLQGNYLGSVRELEVALTVAQGSGIIRCEAFALTTLGDVFLDLGGLEAAFKAYDQAAKLANQVNERFLIFYLLLSQAQTAQLKGLVEQAETYQAQAAQYIAENSTPYEQGIFHLRCGEMALHVDNYVAAIQDLRLALKSFSDQGYQIECLQTALYLAVAYQHEQNLEASRQYYEQALGISKKMDNRHPLTIAGYRIRKHLQSSSNNLEPLHQLKLQVNQFKHDQARLRRKLRQQVSAISFDHPQITIRTLGEMQVQLKNRTISNSEWLNQPQMRELFFYLLLHPTGLSKDDLDASLWPDSSQSQLKRKVRNTIYRLRRTLEAEVIVFNSHTDLYQFNRNLDYDYDAENFRNLLNVAKEATSGPEKQLFYEKAVQCYQGPFLPHLDGQWVWSEREALSKDYVNANMLLAQLYLQSHTYDEALDCYKRVLSEVPGFEEAYREAMRVQAQLGNRLAVARLYERCQSELEEEVGVPVSPQTQELYQALIQ
ncbi:MAG: BTAD domain-containing putative transcriptional regulator [Chloroflexota bacterium]